MNTVSNPPKLIPNQQNYMVVNTNPQTPYDPFMASAILPEDIFKKYDSNKLRYDLLPNKIIEDVVKVMMYGAFTKNYGVGNWMKASTEEDFTRYYNAERRHIEAYRKGEYNDPESGLPHLAHAICNLMFLHYLEEKKRNG